MVNKYKANEAAAQRRIRELTDPNEGPLADEIGLCRYLAETALQSGNVPLASSLAKVVSDIHRASQASAFRGGSLLSKGALHHLAGVMSDCLHAALAEHYLPQHQINSVVDSFLGRIGVAIGEAKNAPEEVL